MLFESNDNDNVIISRIITAADEKILRTFQPPYNLIKFIQQLRKMFYLAKIMIMNITTNVYFTNLDYGDVDGSKQALSLMTNR
jgi:hypothetical protein